MRSQAVQFGINDSNALQQARCSSAGVVLTAMRSFPWREKDKNNLEGFRIELDSFAKGII